MTFSAHLHYTCVHTHAHPHTFPVASSPPQAPTHSRCSMHAPWLEIMWLWSHRAGSRLGKVSADHLQCGHTRSLWALDSSRSLLGPRSEFFSSSSASNALEGSGPLGLSVQFSAASTRPLLPSQPVWPGWVTTGVLGAGLISSLKFAWQRFFCFSNFMGLGDLLERLTSDLYSAP